MSLNEFIRRTWLENAEIALDLADRLVAHGATLAAEGLEVAARTAQALDAAHRLAGSLGMYGLSEGSELASLLEDQLRLGGLMSVSEFSRIAQCLRQEIVDADV